MPTKNDRVFDLVRQYRYNTNLFSEEQVDELQQLATQFDIPFKRKTEEFKLRNIAQQAQMGFLEGFTTIPVANLSGSQAKTTYESIAFSLGHLAGFAPGIIAAPITIAAKGVGKLGLKQAKGKMLTGASFVGKANNWSVPMMAGDKVRKGFEYTLQKSGAETLSFLKRGSAARSILDQSIHLGVASATSSIWKGPDAIMDSGVHGAIAGGAFGGLGEIRFIGNYLKSVNPNNYRKGEQKLKGVIGATMLGLPAAMQDQPTEMILYETLLGGFFGYKSRPAMEAEGGKFIKDLMFDGTKKHIFDPESHKSFDTYSDGAKEYIVKQSTDYAKDYLIRQYETLSGYPEGHPMHPHTRVPERARKLEGLDKVEDLSIEQINKEYRRLANEVYLARDNKGITPVAKSFSDKVYEYQKKEDVDQDSEIKHDSKLNETLSKEKEKKVFIIKVDANGNVEVVGGMDMKDLGVNGDYNGRVVGEKRPEKNGRPADELENTEFITFDGIFLEKTFKFKNKKTGLEETRTVITDFKPLSTETRNTGSPDFKDKLENKQTKDVKWKVDVQLDENSMYLYGGVKDKGVMTIRKYHDHINRYTREELLRALSSNGRYTYEELKSQYLVSLNHAAKYHVGKNKEDVRKLHDKWWKSNILADSERHGFYDSEVLTSNERDLRDIHNITRKGFSKNVLDWNKREQLYNDKSMPLEKNTLGGALEFAVFEEAKKESYIDTKGERKEYDSDTDGTLYFLERDVKKMMESLGLPYFHKKKGTISMFKPVMVVKVPGHGVMVVKAAGRTASDPISKYMEDNGLRALIMKSAAKHTGLMESNVFDTNLLEKGTYGHIGELKKYEMKETDIRINTGTYVKHESALKMQRIARQFASVLNGIQTPGAMEILWNDVYKPNIYGNETLRQFIDPKHRIKDIEKLSEHVSKNEIGIDDVGIDLIHSVFVHHGDSKLARKWAREIARMDKDGELDDVDTFTEYEHQQYVYRNDRILDVSDFAQSQREAGLWSREFFERNYKKYALSRLYSPKYKYSAKSWLAPKDPHILFSNDLKEGTFKLDKDMDKMDVRYDFGKGKGPEDTLLGKAWKHYVNKGKKGDTGAFEFLIIRVPSDSVSGTRLLKFDGFTEQQGFAITTNAKDNAYLGGADKDSDTVFLYQDMPKKVRDAVGSKENQNEWTNEKGQWIDGKLRDDLFGAEVSPEYNHVMSKFSPTMRRTVAETAAAGQDGIGIAARTRGDMVAVADLLLKNNGSLEGIPLYKNKKDNSGNIILNKETGLPETEIYGYFDINLKDKAHKKLYTLGREMLQRSADAANYSKSMDYSQFPEVLFNSAFEGNFRFVKQSRSAAMNKNQKINWKQITRGSYIGDVVTSGNFVKPNSKHTWAQTVTRIQSLGDMSRFDNLSSRVANEMKKTGLDTELYDSKLIQNYADLLVEAKNMIKRQENKNDIIKVLNQIFPQKNVADLLVPTNIIRDLKSGNYKSALYKLERDFNSLASIVALNKKGLEIYHTFESMGITDKKLQRDLVNKTLGPIAEKATNIKMRSIENMRDKTKGSTEGEPNGTIGEIFDAEVKAYKLELTMKAKKYGMNPDTLHTYFDLWLLSPFKHKFVGSDSNKDLTRQSKIPYQSREVSSNSLKYLLDVQQDIYHNMNLKLKKQPIKKTALFDFKEKSSLPYDKYTEKIFKSDEDFLRSRAITDKDYKEVLDFELTLNKNPYIKDNLKDFYENMTLELEGARKDFNIVDMNDIAMMNRFLKDMDMRTKGKNTKLPDFAWRASPEYMDLFMRNFEEKFFISSYDNVKTRDNVIRRKVKKYTSTLGDLKHFIQEVNRKMDSDTQLVPGYNNQRYLHRQLPIKESTDINVIVSKMREGRNPRNKSIGIDDYLSSKEYKQLSNKKFVVKDRGVEKTFTLDEMINRVDEIYTKDYKEFGMKKIYAMNNNKTEYIDFDLIDKKFEYKRYNEHLKWNENGRFDMQSFINKTIKSMEKGGSVPDIPLEVLYRAHYEYKLETFLNKEFYKPNFKTKYKSRKGYREWYRKNNPFERIGRFKDIKDQPSWYVPHLNYGKNKEYRLRMQEYIETRAKQKYDEVLRNTGDVSKAERAEKMFRLKANLIENNSKAEDAGGAISAIEDIMFDMNKMNAQDLKNIGSNNRPQSVLERTENEMPGWDDGPFNIDLYKESVIRSQYKNLLAFQARYKIDKFIEKNAFGENTKHWALYLRTYFRDSMGAPSVFGDDLVKYMDADKSQSVYREAIKEGKTEEEAIHLSTKFTKRGVYQFSDQKVIEGIQKIRKQFKKKGREVPFMKDIPDPPKESLRKTDRELYDLQERAYMEAMTRAVHNLGRYEAKAQLITLLSHSKLYTGNYFGGTSNTITRNGLKNFIRVNNKKFLLKNIIKAPNGTYNLKFNNGKEVKTVKDLNLWIGEKGVIESFINNELNVSSDFSNIKGKTKQNMKDFASDLSKKLLRNPDLDRSTILDIAKKYQVDQIVESSAAWFMQASERRLRRDAFLTNALEYMEHFGKEGYKLGLNDPAVFEAGIRGVEATQYIYHSSGRPGFMRTSLGKVLSRFKLFVFNSVRIRKEMLRKASYYGYKPGTNEYEKFKTDFAINMFVMALGTAFAYSLFDTALPPPYDWAQETGDWLLGDKKTRDKAFFSQYPYPIAPLNIITPPVARIPMEFFTSLINKDWDRFMNYHLYTMFPFGRMIRSIDKTIDEPYGTLEGRAMQQFFGMPLDKVRSKINRAEVLKARKQMINSELGELYVGD